MQMSISVVPEKFLFWIAVLMSMLDLILTNCITLSKHFTSLDLGFLICESMNLTWMISKITMDYKII